MTFFTDSKFCRFLCGVAAICFLFCSPAVLAEGPETISPPGVPAKSDSEFYSTNQREKVLIPVNIWGEVKEPGLHYVPLGTTVLQSISLAGGPLLTARLPDVHLYLPSGQEEELNVYKVGAARKVQPNDTVQVDVSSFRVDFPVILGVATLGVSLIGLVYLIAHH